MVDITVAIGEKEVAFLKTLYRVTGGNMGQTAPGLQVLKKIGIDDGEYGEIIRGQVSG